MKRYKPLHRLEELTLGDLRGNQGMSPMSLRFKKERNKIMGSETRRTSFADCIINKDGSVDFIFISESTDKYSDDFEYKRSPQYKNYQLIKNSEETYSIVIRILEFNGWLETYPEKIEITAKDIKDIFDVSEIEIDSDVPSFYWQGGAYYLQQLGGTITKKSIKKPEFWNNSKYHGDGNMLIDKITQSVLNQISFYKNIMGSALTKRLKKIGKI